jgi:predicted transcriptional regulator
MAPPRVGGVVGLSSKRKRLPLEIMVDILKAASGKGVTMTALTYRSNSNFLRTCKYVELLTSRDLLECVNSTPKMYRTTARGDKAARVLADAVELVFGADGHDNPPSRPAAFQGPTRVAPVTGDEPGLREVRNSFEKLSGICKLRNGDNCGPRGEECKLAACFLFAPEKPMSAG